MLALRLSPDWSRLVKPKIGLADRFAFYASVAILFALVMLATLSYYNFVRSLDDIYRSRMSVTANELRLGIENNLGLGLALGEIPGIHELLDFTVRENPDLLGLGVFNQDGSRLLFAAGESPSHEPALFAASAPRTAMRHVTGGKAIWISLPLHNPFGLLAGYLVVGLPMAPLHMTLAGVRWALFSYLILFALVMLPLLFVGSRIIFQPLLKRLEAISGGESLNLERPLERNVHDFLVAKKEVLAVIESTRESRGARA